VAVRALAELDDVVDAMTEALTFYQSVLDRHGLQLPYGPHETP
jgi:hypothetical protein